MCTHGTHISHCKHMHAHCTHTRAHNMRTHTYTHIYTRVCILYAHVRGGRQYAHVSMHTYARQYARMHISMHVCTSVCTRMHVSMHVSMHTYAVDVYAHTHTWAHTIITHVTVQQHVQICSHANTHPLSRCTATMELRHTHMHGYRHACITQPCHHITQVWAASCARPSSSKSNPHRGLQQ